MPVVVFTFTMFLSAVLLFLVEPMLAKMMLPMLGGTPAVWNTCLVFYQATLLAGYLYVHATTRWLKRKAQVAVHIAVVSLPLLVFGLLPLRLAAGWEPPAESNPALWILAILSISAGLPFFALSASSPILQRWFADTGHRQAKDPYFLYAASNAGSLIGLLAYPLLLEPLLRLSEQSHLWSWGYTLFAAMMTICAFAVWSRRSVSDPVPHQRMDVVAKSSLKERLRWIALAFVPSSLMLGVTTALTIDVPAIPLFWVLPLALYLLSFVMVFARRPPVPHRLVVRCLPALILAGLFPFVSKEKLTIALLMALYLLLLFGVAMFCHGELAKSRPQVSRLTEFYLLISVGGVLGGAFNSLLAPVVFRSAMEFPLVLIFTALLLPTDGQKLLTEGAEKKWARRKDWLLPLALGLTMALLIFGTAHFDIKPGLLVTTLFFAYSMLWCFSFHKRTLRFAAGLTALLLASAIYTGPLGHILDTERSFFGVSRVTNDPEGRFRFLIHSGTLHGVQSLNPARSLEPLAYYTRSGPAGQIFRAVQAGIPHGNWAVVGLGAGAMACLTQPGETLTYYEIDPLVVRIAENPRYFTYLEQCAPAKRIVLGDARLKLRQASDASYGLIALDAFSGDSIPMHLLTREALALYLRKLAPHGIIAFHISNLNLRLAPTLGDLAADAHLVCLAENDTVLTPQQIDEGKTPSLWLVMARSQTDFSNLTTDTGSFGRWNRLAARPGARVWTDDYSNLLSVIKWVWGVNRE